eukprot:12041847-Heterocapsa_arctica.AAC.1
MYCLLLSFAGQWTSKSPRLAGERRSEQRSASHRLTNTTCVFGRHWQTLADTDTNDVNRPIL